MTNPLTEKEAESILKELYRRSPTAPTEDEQLAVTLKTLKVDKGDVKKLLGTFKKEEKDA